MVDAGAKGKSIAKTPEGQVIFVKNAIPGDVVDIQTFKKRRNYYEGEAVNFHNYSDRRTEPVCKHFGTCGGCKWQHMAYESQLFFKQKEVTENLKRISKADLPDITPIVGSDQQYYYRNKMEFSFSANRWLTVHELESGETITERDALGFHIPGMWDKVLHLDECHLHPEIGEKIRLGVFAFAKAKNISFYDPREKTGLLRSLMLRMASTGEVMVVVQFFYQDKPEIERVMGYIKDEFPEVKSLQYIVNEKANDSIYDQTVELYHGRDHIYEELENLKFKISAKSFYQTNSRQAEKLYSLTRQACGLTGDELVYDLYTGTGTIALYLAHKAKKVIGVEAVPAAIADAEVNAANNKIENASFYVGDMKDVLTEEFISKHGYPDVVVTDPPRDGMHKKVVEQLLTTRPERIAYVSCNSATQARDLEILKQAYTVNLVQPVDMFPQTHHVENILRLDLIKE